MNVPISLRASIFCLIAACHRAPPGPSPSPPATVSQRVPESSLTTVSLSPRAASRLGLETVRAHRRRVPRVREFGGEAVAPAGRSAALVAPVAGVLRRVHATVGSRVARGSPLLSLVPLAPTDRDLRAQSTQSLAAALARLTAAEARAQRTAQLARDRAGSQRMAEEALADREVARAAVTAARARDARLQRAPLESDVALALRSPLDGVLRQVVVAEGQTVAAGTLLAELSAVDELWIRVPVFAGDLAAIDPAREAAVFDLAGHPQGAGRAVNGPLTADANLATVDRFYAVDNRRGALRPGERVSVQVPLRSETESVVVPTGAVVYDLDGGAWVYAVMAPGTFVRRRVALARVVGSEAVLARGLEEGTTVVSVGAAELWGTEFGAGH